MTSDPATQGHCPNINARGVRRRLFSASLSLILAVALAAILVGMNWPRGVRLALVLPFWFSMLGFFQSAERTCVVQAARGMRETDDGEVPICDSERAAISRQAKRVYAEATAAALVMTAVVYLL